jgi:Right handed beta helix region
MRALRHLAAAVLLASVARADVLHVPSELFPTIQDGVDAAVSGDTVLIASGTYAEQVVLQNVSFVRLRGQGKVELTGTSAQTGITLDGCIGSSVERIRLVGFDTGLIVTGCVDVTVSNCRASGLEEVGFQVANSTNTLLERCVVDEAGNEGIFLFGLLGCEVRRCTVRACSDGLLVASSTAVEIQRLRAENIGFTGLNVSAPCDGLEVQRSRFVDVGSAGIVTSADDGRFSRNVVLDSNGFGIQAAAGSERNIFDRQRVVGSDSAAFDLNGQAHELTRCRAAKVNEHGIRCAGTGGHLVQDGRITTTGFTGLLVELGSEGCVVLDNRITHSAGDGMRIVGDFTTLTGNTVNSSAADGFFIESFGNSLTENKAHGSGLFDLRDTAGASTYVDNVFGTVAT